MYVCAYVTELHAMDEKKPPIDKLLCIANCCNNVLSILANHACVCVCMCVHVCACVCVCVCVCVWFMCGVQFVYGVPHYKDQRLQYAPTHTKHTFYT